MVYNFLCKDEKKNTQKYLLTFAENIGVERSPPFFRTVYPNRNHVTTHPVSGTKKYAQQGLFYKKHILLRVLTDLEPIVLDLEPVVLDRSRVGNQPIY